MQHLNRNVPGQLDTWEIGEYLACTYCLGDTFRRTEEMQVRCHYMTMATLPKKGTSNNLEGKSLVVAWRALVLSVSLVLLKIFICDWDKEMTG